MIYTVTDTVLQNMLVNTCIAESRKLKPVTGREKCQWMFSSRMRIDWNEVHAARKRCPIIKRHFTCCEMRYFLFLHKISCFLLLGDIYFLLLWDSISLHHRQTHTRCSLEQFTVRSQRNGPLCVWTCIVTDSHWELNETHSFNTSHLYQ